MHGDPPRNGSNVSEDRENPVVDGRGSRPLKGLRCEHAISCRRFCPLYRRVSRTLLREVVPVVLLHDVERTIRRESAGNCAWM